MKQTKLIKSLREFFAKLFPNNYLSHELAFLEKNSAHYDLNKIIGAYACLYKSAELKGFRDLHELYKVLVKRAVREEKSDYEFAKILITAAEIIPHSFTLTNWLKRLILDDNIFDRLGGRCQRQCQRHDNTLRLCEGGQALWWMARHHV